jgi:hypothetical protein
MSQLFDITVDTPTIRLDENGCGETTITVTNLSGEARRLTVQLATIHPQHQNWLKLEGDQTREFAAHGGSHQYQLNIQVPAATFKGRFNCRLDVYSASKEEKLVQGPNVSVEMKPQPKPSVVEPSKKNFSWITATVMVLLLVTLGVVAALWLLFVETASYSEQVSDIKEVAHTALTDSDRLIESANQAFSNSQQAIESANITAFKASSAIEIANKAIIQTEKAQTMAINSLNQVNQLIRSTNHYRDNGNGTVTDNSTGLIWLKNANCFGPTHWEQAQLLAQQLKSGECGLSDHSQAGDWHLPSQSEWHEMMNSPYYNPALSNTVGTDKWVEGQPFLEVNLDGYWTATPFVLNNDRALIVDMINAAITVRDKTDSYYVWPVRNH